MATTASSAPVSGFFARHWGKLVAVVAVSLIVYAIFHYRESLVKRWTQWFPSKEKANVSSVSEVMLPGRLPIQGKALVVRGEYISPAVYTYTQPGYLHEWVTSELRLTTNGSIITLIIQAAEPTMVGVRVDSTNVTDILSVTAGAYSLTNLPSSIRATPIVPPPTSVARTNAAARSVRLPAVPPPLEAGEGKTMVRWVTRQAELPAQSVSAAPYSSLQPAAFVRPDEDRPKRPGWFARTFGPPVAVVAPYPYPYYQNYPVARVHVHAGGRWSGSHNQSSHRVTYGQVTYTPTYQSSAGRQYAGYYYGAQGNKVPTRWP